MLRLLAALSLALVACKPSTPPPAEQPVDAGPSAVAEGDSKALLAQVDRLKDQLKDKPKTFEILGALGNLYYENGRFLEAVDSYREAEELAAPAEARRDALMAKGVKPAATLPAECRRSGSDYGLAQIVEAAKKLAPPAELRCLQATLELATAARARRGNALYLIGNPDGALAEHRKVLAREKDYPESLFFVGAILLEQSQGDKAMLEEGKKYWRRLVEVAPDHPRAALAKESLPRVEEMFAPKPAGQTAMPSAQGGSVGLPPGHPPMGNAPQAGADSHEPTPEEIDNVEKAAAATERTPELEKGLDDLVRRSDKALDAGNFQEARDAAVRVMAMRPTDAHVAANLGGAIRGLGRVEVAERTLARALELNPKEPRALFELAKIDAQRGDKPKAAQRLQALKSADPAFAKAHGVDAELAKLR